MATLRFYLRNKLTFLLLWSIPLALLIASIPPAIKESYPDLAQVDAIVEQMQAMLGTRVMYGIPTVGMGYAGWVVWEALPWAMILGSVMAIMLAASVGRAAEEKGQLEVILGTGTSIRTTRILSIFTVLIAALFLGLLCTLALLVQVPNIIGFTVTGSILCGLLVTASVSISGLITILFGEVFGTARQARSMGLAFLALFFGIRAAADVYEISWLRWLTPLGWRDLVKPYTEDNVWPFLFFVLIMTALTIPIIGRERDLGDQWLHVSDQNPRAKALGPLGLLWNLQRSPILWWALSVLICGVLFFSMSGEMSSMLTDASETVRIMLSYTGIEDIGEVFAEYVGQFLGILVGCAAVRTAICLSTAEHNGYLDVHLSTGSHRLKLLYTTVAFALVGTILTVVVTGFLSARVALLSDQVNESMYGHILWALIDLIPGCIALIGFGVLFLGFHSKTANLAWIPVIFSGFVTFFGELLRLPDWLMDLSVFAWAPHTVDHYTGALVLIIIGSSTTIIGSILYNRRDLA